MRQRISLIAFAASAAFVAGCGSSGSAYKPVPVKPVEPVAVQSVDEKSLFPIKTGNQWTYTGQTITRVSGRQGNTDFEMTFKIVKATPKGNGQVADIEVTTNLPNSKVDHQRWEVNDKGIYQLAVGNPPVPFNPPQPIALFPLETDRKFAWKGLGMTPGGKSGTSNLNGKILAAQEVDGASERFSAIGVETKGTFTVDKANGQVASTAFWSPGVGLVRYRQEIMVGENVAVQTLRLKAKTLR